jgi:predicted nucleic acid-binding protein
MTSGPLPRGLIDTPIVLSFRTGDADACRFALEMLRYHLIEMSEFTAMAVLARCPDAAELQRERAFLKNSLVRRVTANISRRAFRILERLPPPCGLTADDALVAATAVEHKLPLYTLDPARFAAVSGLTAVRPY